MKKTVDPAPQKIPQATARRLSLEVCAKGFRLAFGEKTYVMGVLNVTPDSFSDGGKFFNRDDAVRHAIKMREEGADIIDVGGESTRPGAADISVEEELKRVMPVITAISAKVDAPVSIDTRKAKVASEAIKAGACIINDVSGLTHDKDMARVVADSGVALIIMHMKGTPRDMQVKPVYKDLIQEIVESLKDSLRIAKAAGIDETKIIIDPGIGFGKTVGHNLEILNRLDEFKALKRPICVGTSRKSFIGKILKIEDAKDRLAGTIATSVLAITKGANLLRVHDIREAKDAARITDSILKGNN